MRTSTIIACLILFCSNSSIMAQDTIRKNMISPTSVTLIRYPSVHRQGALYQLNDSSIMVSNSIRLKDYRQSNFIVSEFDIIDILRIQTVSRTRTRNGALIGAASGFIIGGVIGLNSNGSSGSGTYGVSLFPDWTAALGGGILFAPIGALIGTIIGGISIKIPINGSMDDYKRSKVKLNKYALKK